MLRCAAPDMRRNGPSNALGGNPLLWLVPCVWGKPYAIRLRACYALPSTDVAYYARATRCPVLRSRIRRAGP
eukprot:1879163-Rhodomonas_salina.1